MNPWTKAAIAGALVLALAGCGAGTDSASAGRTFRIVSPYDGSGKQAIIGQTYRPGLDAAVTEVNRAGGILGRHVTVDYIDVQSDPQRASDELNDALARRDYDAVIAASAGTTTLALLQAVKVNGALGVFTGGVPDAADPAEYPTQFDLKYPIASQAKATGCLALAQHPRSAAILNLDSQLQNAESDIWKKQFAAAGVRVVGAERFPADQLDLTAQVQRIASARPDVVVLETYGPTLKTAFRAMRDVGLRARVVGGGNVTATPPQVVLGGLDLIPPGTVAMAWPGAVRADGRLTAAQQRALNVIEPLTKGVWRGSLSQYLYNYDAVHLVKFAAERARSTEPRAMTRALESLGAHPAETGAVTPPGYTPHDHGYPASATFYTADLKQPARQGTYTSRGPIRCGA
ncbi:ABC transporter substrate-binding protein [Actinomadura darangshiensis]|uniref:ABC transporter substrate-binding protein n=1 Tax=Actinomadura darangshiensis TaxID=705336 RepID=A0A4R5B6I5_9ACTN|nr:ABC transporter substrate-binding protein [Actinomadura darangshiensis]TDD79254.1 ABC transporter substrate-binding protein [Actinomadura darangshiensis]